MSNKEMFKKVFGMEPLEGCPGLEDETNDICENYFDCEDGCPLCDYWEKEYDENFVEKAIKKVKEGAGMKDTEEEKIVYPDLGELPDCNYDCEHCSRFQDDDDEHFFDDDEDDEIRMITAEGARAVSDHYFKEAIDKEIDMLNKEIVDACKLGRESVCINDSISVGAKELLKKNGFKVTSGTQYNESYTNISWGV